MFYRLLMTAVYAAAMTIAAPILYTGAFMPVNGSGVTGQVALTLDGTSLTVHIAASP